MQPQLSKKLRDCYRQMMNRCYESSYCNYKYYGGRGIKVCKEWIYDRNSFFMWAVKAGVASGLAIDRIDNDGDYTPDNCRWATAEANMNNRRCSKKITWRGRTLTQSQWSRELGLSAQMLRYRLSVYDIETALTKQVDHRPPWN